MYSSTKKELYKLSEYFSRYLNADIHLDKTSPFIVKNWNIGFIYIRESGLFSIGYITKFSMYRTYLRCMLFFYTYALVSIRFPKILFIGHSTLRIQDYILNLHIFENLRKIIFGIDFWFSGFLNVKKRNNQYHKFIKGLKERQLYIGLFARTTVSQSRYLKKVVRYLKRPSILFFFKNVGTTYFAGYESYIKMIPSIALVSPESKSFGFSGMTFTLPFPFQNSEDQIQLHNFFVKVLWYTDFLNQQRFGLERLQFEKNKSLFNNLQTFKELLVYYRFFQLVSVKHKLKNEIRVRDIVKSWNPDFVIGSRSLFEKVEDLNRLHNYIKHNILYVCNFMIGFLFYCIWKRQGQVYDKTANWYMFKDKPLYVPFMKVVKFFTQFKKNIFHFIPNFFFYYKYLHNFKYKIEDYFYANPDSNINIFFKGFDFKKECKSSNISRNLSTDFFLTVRKLKVFHNLSSLINHRLLNLNPKLRHRERLIRLKAQVLKRSRLVSLNKRLIKKRFHKYNQNNRGVNFLKTYKNKNKK